ncbi:MAG: hypothetical protein C0404_14695 [Verrucomicrobia bacterium]|nr:hypothetical protein [Verrucomicrobiota bacterium]
MTGKRCVMIIRYVFSVGLFAAVAAPLAVAQDSPCFRGPNRDGSYPGAQLRLNWAEKPPKILWKKDVGFGFSQVVTSGKLALTCGYQPDKDASFLYCFDAETGADQWQIEYKDTFGGARSRLLGPIPTPAIDDGRVYVVAAMGAIYCYELGTQKKIWEKVTNKDTTAKLGDYGDSVSPVVSGDLVIAHLTLGPDSAAWHAFQKKDGLVAWTHPVEARKPEKKNDHIDRAYVSAVPFLFKDKPRVILISNATIDCVEAGSGKLAWRFPIDDLKMEWGPLIDAIVFDGDKFLLGCWYGNRATAFVFQMTGDSLKEVWSNKTLGKLTYSYVLRNQYAYGFGPKGMQCVDLKDGGAKWEWRPEDSRAKKDQGETILVGDKLVWLSTSGTLYAGEATPDKPGTVSEFPVIGRCTKDLKKLKASFNEIICTSPSFSGGRLYCRSPWGEVVCVDVSK